MHYNMGFPVVARRRIRPESRDALRQLVAHALSCDRRSRSFGNGRPRRNALIAAFRDVPRIGAQVEAMYERTPSGGTHWFPSCVKSLLHRAPRAIPGHSQNLDGGLQGERLVALRLWKRTSISSARAPPAGSARNKIRRSTARSRTAPYARKRPVRRGRRAVNSPEPKVLAFAPLRQKASIPLS